MTRRHTWTAERGAMLVQVALSIMVLLGFTVFVVDYGVVWVARGQAQNAADAGALSGAVARAFDDRLHPVATTLPRMAAISAASENAVWTEAPVVGEPQFSWNGEPCPPGIAGRCARVDVFRNVENNNPLPVFFGPLLGVAEQGVRATATARTAVATATNCLKPWAVVDKWIEHRDGDLVREADWTPAEKFEKFVKKGNEFIPYTPPDEYVPPTPTATGTGFTSQDTGAQLVLNPRSFSGNNTDIYGGAFVKLRLTCPGADCYEEAIVGCNGTTYAIGETIEVDTQDGQIPQKTAKAISQLVARDPGASWAGSGVTGSSYSTSPRIVPIALINIDTFPPNPTGATLVPIVNIVGFFIEGTCATVPSNRLTQFSQTVCNSAQGSHDAAYIVGRLSPMPGLIVADSPVPIGEESSFLSVIQLVR